MAFEVTIPAVGIDLGNSMIKVVAGLKAPRSKKNPDEWVEQPTMILSHVDEDMAQNELTVRPLEAALDATIRHDMLPGGGGRWRAGLAVARDRVRGHLGESSDGGKKVESLPVLVTGLMALSELGVRLALQSVGSEAKLKKAAEGVLHVRINALGASLPYGQHETTKETLKQILRRSFTLTFHSLPKLGDLRLNVSIGSVTTTPEGRSAVVAEVFTQSPEGAVVYRSERHAALMREPLGVLDVGGGTTDLLLFDVIPGAGGKPTWSLDTDRSRTIDFGINAAIKTAVEGLKKDDWGAKFPNEAALTAYLRTGARSLTDRSSGKEEEHPLLPYLKNQDMKLLADQINKRINTEWNREIGTFLLVGGGAQLVHECGYLNTKRTPLTVEDPEWANAIGNYLLAVRLNQK